MAQAMKIGKVIGWVILAVLALVVLWFPQVLRGIWYKVAGSDEQKAAAAKAQEALQALK